mmetsp:Transcript_112072/g.282115  ORF Transcript_112072/g.282115 Transcript_112072/m.282115 type:complete len:209 (-) Transcript_112072:34-660(-)
MMGKNKSAYKIRVCCTFDTDPKSTTSSSPRAKFNALMLSEWPTDSDDFRFGGNERCWPCNPPRASPARDSACSRVALWSLLRCPCTECTSASVVDPSSFLITERCAIPKAATEASLARWVSTCQDCCNSDVSSLPASTESANMQGVPAPRSVLQEPDSVAPTTETAHATITNAEVVAAAEPSMVGCGWQLPPGQLPSPRSAGKVLRYG